MHLSHPKILHARLDRKFQVHECSHSLEFFLGRLAMEVQGVNLLTFIPQPEFDELTSNIRKNLASDLSWFGEVAFLAKNGQRVWADVAFNLQGEEIAFSGIEITEQKRIQLSIKENLRFQETLMQEAPVGIFLSSASGQCEYVNKKWLAMTGVSQLQVIGDGWLSALHPDDRERVQEHWAAALEGSQQPLEYRYLKPDGSVSVVVARCRLIDGRQVLRIEDDVTAQRAQQKIVEEQNRKIFEDTNLVALGTIAAGIAHEINNPLVIAMGYMDELSDRTDPKSERSHYLLNRISKSLERIEQIVISTKLMSRKPQRGDLQEFDLSTLREESLSIFFSNQQEKDLQISWDDVALPFAYGRYPEVLQVVLNLLSNSAQALEGVGVKKISVTTVLTSRCLELRVTDSGPGVPMDISQRIFDPFFTTKDPGSGTGLGLSISKRIMLMMGGDLHLESCFPATFCVSLPRKN